MKMWTLQVRHVMQSFHTSNIVGSITYSFSKDVRTNYRKLILTNET